MQFSLSKLSPLKTFRNEILNMFDLGRFYCNAIVVARCALFSSCLKLVLLSVCPPMFLNVYLCVCVGTLHFEIRASLVSQAGIKVTFLE